jgi:uncharacterized protein HemX
MPRRAPFRPEWDNKIGTASVLGAVQIIAIIAGLGAMYGALSGKLDAAATNAIEAKTATTQTADKINRESARRDEKIASQAERIGKIETSIQFVVPAIQRIEAKIDAKQ